MVSSQLTLASLASILPTVLAGFNANSQSNVAVYWGQNSYGQASSQVRLSNYCSSKDSLLAVVVHEIAASRVFKETKTRPCLACAPSILSTARLRNKVT